MNEAERATLEKELRQLFIPQVVLPSQFFLGPSRRAALRGEHRLVFAILEDAIRVYLKECTARRPRGRHLFRKAEEWIFSTDSRWIFSFERVCEVLQIDPQYLRRGLLGWRRRALQRRLSLVVRDGATLGRAAAG